MGQRVDKEALARLLKIDVANVRSRYTGTHPIMFLNTQNRPSICTAGRPDWVITFLAYRRLYHGNGLNALKEEHVEFELESGSALHFLGDVKQTFSGIGVVLVSSLCGSYIKKS